MSIDAIRNHALYYQQDLRVPMTFLTIVYHGAGFQQEAPDLSGLARITAKTLFRGTPTLTRETISRRFDLLGALVEANVSETDFYITISAFSKNLPETMKLVTSILREADFPEDEITTVKKQELNSMEAALQEPEHVLSAANDYVLYGRNRMGKLGSRAAIGRIEREDVLEYMEHVRRTAVLYSTTITDLPKERIEELLGGITSGRELTGFSLHPEKRYIEAEGYEAFVVDSRDATNDRLMWSHRGIDATDNRRFDLSLIIDALGSFEGFLFDELRNKNGWCYGAYGYVMQATTRPGRIAYYADPSSESSDKLIPALLGFLSTFHRESNFLDRLSERNTTFKNRYAYQLDVKKKLSNEVHRDRYGVPILSREEYNARIDAVTRESANRTIEELFHPSNLTMVFYGDAKRIGEILGRLERRVSITTLDTQALVQ